MSNIGQLDPSEKPGRGALSFALLSGAAYLLAAGVYFTRLALQGWSTLPYFPLVLGLLLGGMAACVFSAGVVRNGKARLGLLSAGAVAGVCLGVLALFTIGVLVLLGGAFAAVAYAKNTTWQKGQSRVVPSVTGGVVALVALGAIFVPTMLPYTNVDCRTGTVVDSGGWGFFGNGGSLSSSGTESINGTSITGRSVVNGHVINFTCRDGRLVRLTGTK